jgi:hypothetical protein
MKITEIVSTPELEESLTGAIGKGLIGLGKKLGGKAAGHADDAAKAAGKTADDVPQSWQDKLYKASKEQRAAAELAKANADKFAKAMENLEPVITKRLKQFLLWESLLEYWYKVSQLHAKYPGSDEEDEQNPEFIKERTRLRGQLIIQWLTPKISNLVLSAGGKAMNAATFGIPVIQSLLKRIPYAGPVVVDLTKPAVRAAVTAFIMTPGGARWLAEVTAEFADPIGSLPTLANNIYNWLTDNLPKEEPAADGKADAGAKDDAGGTSTGGAAASGQAGQPAGEKIDRMDFNRPAKIAPYDFTVADVLDKKHR